MHKAHDQVMALLPWYVNDTLTGKEADAVLRHLGECRICQEERDRLYRLQQLVQETGDAEDAPDHQLSFRRVMKRIDAAERNRESTEEVAMPSPGRSRWLPMGVAASVLSIMMVGVAWFSGESVEPEVSGETFQTLSSDQPVPGRAARLELGFVSPIPAVTLRKALIETNSNIVSGPDENGNYLVEVMMPAGVSPGDYLTNIRRIDGVERARFANGGTGQ